MAEPRDDGYPNSYGLVGLRQTGHLPGLLKERNEDFGSSGDMSMTSSLKLASSPFPSSSSRPPLPGGRSLPFHAAPSSPLTDTSRSSSPPLRPKTPPKKKKRPLTLPRQRTSVRKGETSHTRTPLSRRKFTAPENSDHTEKVQRTRTLINQRSQYSHTPPVSPRGSRMRLGGGGGNGGGKGSDASSPRYQFSPLRTVTTSVLSTDSGDSNPFSGLSSPRTAPSSLKRPVPSSPRRPAGAGAQRGFGMKDERDRLPERIATSYDGSEANDFGASANNYASSSSGNKPSGLSQLMMIMAADPGGTAGAGGGGGNNANSHSRLTSPTAAITSPRAPHHASSGAPHHSSSGAPHATRSPRVRTRGVVADRERGARVPPPIATTTSPLTSPRSPHFAQQQGDARRGRDRESGNGRLGRSAGGNAPQADTKDRSGRNAGGNAFQADKDKDTLSSRPMKPPARPAAPKSLKRFRPKRPSPMPNPVRKHATGAESPRHPRPRRVDDSDTTTSSGVPSYHDQAPRHRLSRSAPAADYHLANNAESSSVFDSANNSNTVPLASSDHHASRSWKPAPAPPSSSVASMSESGYSSSTSSLFSQGTSQGDMHALPQPFSMQTLPDKRAESQRKRNKRSTGGGGGGGNSGSNASARSGGGNSGGSGGGGGGNATATATTRSGRGRTETSRRQNSLSSKSQRSASYRPPPQQQQHMPIPSGMSSGMSGDSHHSRSQHGSTTTKPLRDNDAPQRLAFKGMRGRRAKSARAVNRRPKSPLKGGGGTRAPAYSKTSSTGQLFGDGGRTSSGGASHDDTETDAASRGDFERPDSVASFDGLTSSRRSHQPKGPPLAGQQHRSLGARTPTVSPDDGDAHHTPTGTMPPDAGAGAGMGHRDSTPFEGLSDTRAKAAPRSRHKPHLSTSASGSANTLSSSGYSSASSTGTYGTGAPHASPHQHMPCRRKKPFKGEAPPLVAVDLPRPNNSGGGGADPNAPERRVSCRFLPLSDSEEAVHQSMTSSRLPLTFKTHGQVQREAERESLDIPPPPPVPRKPRKPKSPLRHRPLSPKSPPYKTMPAPVPTSELRAPPKPNGFAPPPPAASESPYGANDHQPGSGENRTPADVSPNSFHSHHDKSEASAAAPRSAQGQERTHGYAPRYSHSRQATAELSPLKTEQRGGVGHAQAANARPKTLGRSTGRSANPFRAQGGGHASPPTSPGANGGAPRTLPAPHSSTKRNHVPPPPLMSPSSSGSSFPHHPAASSSSSSSGTAGADFHMPSSPQASRHKRRTPPSLASLATKHHHQRSPLSPHQFMSSPNLLPSHSRKSPKPWGGGVVNPEQLHPMSPTAADEVDGPPGSSNRMTLLGDVVKTDGILSSAPPAPLESSSRRTIMPRQHHPPLGKQPPKPLSSSASAGSNIHNGGGGNATLSKSTSTLSSSCHSPSSDEEDTEWVRSLIDDQMSPNMPSASTFKNPIYSGYLKKRGVKLMKKSWKYRYCLIHGGFLYWLQSETADMPLGRLRLTEPGLRIEMIDKRTCQITNLSKTWVFEGTDASEMTTWLKYFKKVASYSDRIKGSHTDSTDEDVDPGVVLAAKARGIDLEALTRGRLFKKYRKGRFQARMVWSPRKLDRLIWGAENKADARGFITFTDILELRDGMLGDRADDLGFTITTKERTLELRAPSADTKHEWINAIQYLRHVTAH